MLKSGRELRRCDLYAKKDWMRYSKGEDNPGMVRQKYDNFPEHHMENCCS